jgi:hypothetical protein
MLHDETGEYTKFAVMTLTERSPAEKSADEKLIVTFDDFPVLDEENPETKLWITSEGTEGRPCFVDKEYILIVAPGDKTNIVHRIWGWPGDVRRFSDRYKAWKADKEAGQRRGTMLQAWRKLSPSMIRELNHFHVYTVEDLANMSDGVCQTFAGIQKYRQMAEDFLATQEKVAISTQLRDAMSGKDREIADLRARLLALEESQRQSAGTTKVEAPKADPVPEPEPPSAVDSRHPAMRNRK